jgi:hypothetical protein
MLAGFLSIGILSISYTPGNVRCSLLGPGARRILRRESREWLKASNKPGTHLFMGREAAGFQCGSAAPFVRCSPTRTLPPIPVAVRVTGVATAIRNATQVVERTSRKGPETVDKDGFKAPASICEFCKETKGRRWCG